MPWNIQCQFQQNERGDGGEEERRRRGEQEGRGGEGIGGGERRVGWRIEGRKRYINTATLCKSGWFTLLVLALWNIF